MSQLRTNAILDAAGGNTATINTVPLRPGVLDPENRIINGAFDFWQRGTSGTANGYVADRWLNSRIGGTVTMSRQTFGLGDTIGTNNPTFFLRQTVSGQSASSDYAIIEQSIEGVRSYAGQTITVFGWIQRSSGSGNVAVELVQDFGTGGSPSAEVNIAPQTLTLTSSRTVFALTFNVPSISGKTLGTNGNDKLRLGFWTSSGSDYNARSNSLGLQTIGVDLWGVHIKVGTHTTAATDLYKQPELGPELARCQRYYWSLKAAAANGNYLRYASGFAFSTSGAAFTFIPPVTMRSTPAVSASGFISIYDGATVQTLASLAISADGSSNEVTTVNVGASSAVLTQFRPYQLLANNNATSVLAFDSEL
jgi:hypothetical protein